MQECGGCTACCYAFPVIELEKPRFTKCKYANKQCNIYNVRPQSCRDCYCAWVTQPEVSEELRPDICGVIFEKVNGDTMLATILRKPTKAAVRQKQNFEQQGYRVITHDSTKLH